MYSFGDRNSAYHACVKSVKETLSRSEIVLNTFILGVLQGVSNSNFVTLTCEISKGN